MHLSGGLALLVACLALAVCAADPDLPLAAEAVLTAAAATAGAGRTLQVRKTYPTAFDDAIDTL